MMLHFHGPMILLYIHSRSKYETIRARNVPALQCPGYIIPLITLIIALEKHNPISLALFSPFSHPLKCPLVACCNLSLRYLVIQNNRSSELGELGELDGWLWLN